MRKEDINKIAGLLTAMRTSSEELEKAYRKKDKTRMIELKRRIRDFQLQIERRL